MSLDEGLRMDGIPALNLWDLVVEVLHSSSNHAQGHQEGARDTHIKTQIQHRDLELSNNDFFLQTRNFLALVPCVTSLKLLKQ